MKVFVVIVQMLSLNVQKCKFLSTDLKLMFSKKRCLQMQPIMKESYAIRQTRKIDK